MHSNVVGVGPLRDYTPLSLGDDQTKGGYARLGALIAQRKAKLEQLSPVLVLAPLGKAIVDPRESTSPYVLPATTHLNADLAAINAASREIKEWQAIMDYLVNLPTKNPDGLSVLVKDDRTREVRGINSRQITCVF